MAVSGTDSAFGNKKLRDNFTPPWVGYSCDYPTYSWGKKKDVITFFFSFFVLNLYNEQNIINHQMAGAQ